MINPESAAALADQDWAPGWVSVTTAAWVARVMEARRVCWFFALGPIELLVRIALTNGSTKRTAIGGRSRVRRRAPAPETALPFADVALLPT
jgi:hypothetical protein